jgi:VWFA-related protein
MSSKLKEFLFPCLILTTFSLVFQIAPSAYGAPQKSIDPDNMLFLDFTISGTETTPTELLPEQVQILVDGVERDIVYFSRITPDTLNSDDPNSWVVANQLRGQHTLILLLDLNSLDNAALNSTRLSIKSMLDSLPKNHNEKMMLVTLGNQLVFNQTFTSDKTKISDALDAVKSTSRRLDYKSLIELISESFTIQYDQNPAQALDDAIREANQFMIQISSRTKSTISGLEVFADWFTGLSGPKNTLFFSGGYPLVPGPVVHDIIRAYNQSSMSRDIISPALLSAKIGSGGNTVSSGKINTLTSKFNRNQLTFFTFDSRDVKSDGLAASNMRWLPQRLVASHNSSHITAGREFLRGMSEATGGSLIFDPRNMLARVTGTTDASYIAGINGIEGEEPGESELRTEIKITDPSGTPENSIHVNKRQSFFTLVAGSGDEVLTGAFNFPYYHRDFSVSFTVGTSEDQLTVQAAIPPEALRFITEGDKQFCILEIFGILVDGEGKSLTENKKYTFAKQFPIRMNETQLQNLLKRPSVSAVASADGIKPGEYTLTVVVRQPRAGLISASTMTIKME